MSRIKVLVQFIYLEQEVVLHENTVA